MYDFIYIVKALATVLITNSHYGNIWPSSSLATGGAIGNALFFLVAGFCLSSHNCNFITWFAKRIKRLYPSVIIATIMGIALRVYSFNNVADIIQLFIWPTAYWFVGSIVIFYAAFYFISKYVFQDYEFIIYIVVLLGYTVSYNLLDTTKWVIENTIWFKSIFYFLIMLTGLSLRKNIKYSAIKLPPVWCLIISIVSLVGFYGQKVLCAIDPKFYKWQFTQHIFLAIFSINFFLFLFMLETEVSKIKNSRIWKGILFLANHTLEIYLIQVPILYVLKRKLQFPLSFFVATILILVGAGVIQKFIIEITALLKLIGTKLSKL